MEITEKFLEENGFVKRVDESWSKYDADSSAQIRRTVDGEGWQLSIVIYKTKEYGVGVSGIPDDNAKTFYGYVNDVQELKLAMLACGKPLGTDWRAKMPYYLKREKGTIKFLIYKREGKKEVYTGIRKDDYNSAMAEIQRLNGEEQLTIGNSYDK